MPSCQLLSSKPKIKIPTRGEGKGLRTVGDEAAEVPADDAVPRRALAVVERLLDVLRDVLLDVELEHRLLCCGGLSVRGSSDTMVAPWASECHGRGGRTNLDGFLLHLVAHVGGLDLGCEARLVLARLRYHSPIGAARAVRWKGSGRGARDAGTTTYHRPGPSRRQPPSHSGRASWAMRRGETLGSR